MNSKQIMKKAKTRNIVSLSLCSLIVIFTLLASILGICAKMYEGDATSLAVGGWYFFRYYTSDSNILLGIVSVIVAIHNIQNLRQNRDELPKWVNILYVVALTGTTITFLTTAFFLTPTNMANGHSFFALYEGNLFFLHFLDPLLGIAAFIFFMPYEKLNVKHALMCISTVFIYSCFYIPFVITKTWPDFYGFTFGGNNAVIPIAAIVFLFIGFLVGFVLIVLRNLVINKKD